MSNRPHIIDGEFQSDKYPTTPRGKVPLSVKDPTAQDLLWEYAQRRRAVDAEFAEDLETCLRSAGYTTAAQRADTKRVRSVVRDACVAVLRTIWPPLNEVNVAAWGDTIADRVAAELATPAADPALTNIASAALVVRNLRLSIDPRLTRAERRTFDDLACAVDAWKFPSAPQPSPGADIMLGGAVPASAPVLSAEDLHHLRVIRAAIGGQLASSGGHVRWNGERESIAALDRLLSGAAPLALSLPDLIHLAEMVEYIETCTGLNSTADPADHGTLTIKPAAWVALLRRLMAGADPALVAEARARVKADLEARKGGGR